MLLCATAVAQNGGSWSERLVEAETPEKLDLLVRELRTQLESGAVIDPELRHVALAATARWIGASVDGVAGSTPLDARIAFARDVARQQGGEDDRLIIENEYARVLIDTGLPLDAQRVLSAARTAHPTAAGALLDTAVLQAAAYRKTCAWDEALATLVECRAALERALAEERGDPQRAPWFEYHSALRLEVLGGLARAWTELGLPDRAEGAIAEQRARLAELSTESPVFADVTFRAAIDRAQYHSSVMDPQAALAAYVELEPIANALEDAQRIELEFQIAVTTLNLALARSEPDAIDASVVERVRRALEQPLVNEAQRAAAWRMLASRAIRARDFDAASEAIEHLDRYRGTSAGGSCGVQFDGAVVAALRAEISLGRAEEDARLALRETELVSAISELEEVWKRNPPRERGIGRLLRGDIRDILSARIRLCLAREPGPAGAEHALDALVRVQALGSLARKAGLEGTTYRTVRDEMLTPTRGALVYFPTTTRVHLFVADSTGVEAFEIADVPTLERSLDPIDRALRTRPAAGDTETELEQALRRAAEILLPPRALARIEGWSSVIVVGDELLGQPPIELLPFGKSDLGRERAISHLPTLPAGVWLVRRAHADSVAQRSGSLALIAAPRVSALDLARARKAQTPIVATAEDLETLTASLPEARRTLRLGPQATRASLRDPAVSGSAVLAILCHGIYDADRDAPAGLLLASVDDATSGACFADELSQLEHVPPLVLLLACGAGRGPSRAGDDTATHLGSVFLERGASTAVLSRADVAYDAIVALGGEFMRASRAARIAPDEALRRARAHVAKTPGMEQRYFYGLVTCFGAGWDGAVGVYDGAGAKNELETTSPARAALLIATAILFALIAGAWAVRARHRRRATNART